MPQAFVFLTAVAGRYGLQNPGLAGNCWRERFRRRSADRKAYGEAECRVQVTANTHLVLQTASPRCQRSLLEFFQSFGRTACEYDRRRLQRLEAVQRAAGGGLQPSTG